MSYHHFTTFERGRIQELLSFGYSHRIIAQKLGHHRSSIAHKVRRNTSDADYVAEVAHAAYKARRQNFKPKSKCTEYLVDTITEKPCVAPPWDIKKAVPKGTALGEDRMAPSGYVNLF